MIPLREQEYIKNRFSQELEGKVKIDFFTQRASKLFVPGREECATCEEAGKLIDEVSALSERVLLTTHEFADEADEAQKLGVDKVPAFVLRGPANRPVRFFGVPGGNEFPNFIETIIDLSKQKVELPPETAKQLKKIKDASSIDVYVTTTCPHCPAVVRAAFRLAQASAKVEASAIEIGEFPRLAEQLCVRSVPFLVLNKQAALAGAVVHAGLPVALRHAASGAPVAPPTPPGWPPTHGASAPLARSGLILPH